MHRKVPFLGNSTHIADPEFTALQAAACNAITENA